MRKVLSLIPVVLLMSLLMSIEASADSHRSTGLVVKVKPADETVVLLENGHQLELVVERAIVLDEHGQRLPVWQALHVGDYIREEGNSGKGGQFLARKISVLWPAWRILESPEH